MKRQTSGGAGGRSAPRSGLRRVTLTAGQAQRSGLSLTGRRALRPWLCGAHSSDQCPAGVQTPQTSQRSLFKFSRARALCPLCFPAVPKSLPQKGAPIPPGRIQPGSALQLSLQPWLHGIVARRRARIIVPPRKVSKGQERVLDVQHVFEGERVSCCPRLWQVATLSASAALAPQSVQKSPSNG